MGDEEFARGLVEGFLEETASDLGALREALLKKEYAEARRLAHSIKGAAFTVRGQELGEAAHTVELNISEENPEAARAAFDLVCYAFERLRASIKTYLDMDGRGAGGP